MAFVLTDDQIIERLRTENKEIVNEIYKICMDILFKEDDRIDSIDSKGSTLIGLVGLSASLVFGLGGILIEKVENLKLPIVGLPMPWLVILYLSASLTLLFSIIYSFRAIRARSDWRWLCDEDLFNEQMICEGINHYKRYLSVHFWKIYENNFRINETKGAHLKAAQRLFVAGLIQLIPIIGIIALYSLKKGGYFQ